MQRSNLRYKISDHSVHMMDSRSHLLGVRAINVPSVVDIGVIKSNEMRSEFRRQFQPRNDLIDALFIIELIVEAQIIRGTCSLNLSLRARPEEACRPHPLLLRQDP